MTGQSMMQQGIQPVDVMSEVIRGHTWQHLSSSSRVSSSAPYAPGKLSSLGNPGMQTTVSRIS